MILSRFRPGKQLAICWLILVCIIATSVAGANLFVHNLFVTLCLLSYTLCYYSWLARGGKLLSFYVFFVTYCLFSNLGQSLLDTFGLTNLIVGANMYDLHGYESVNNMLRFQSTCIAALNLGTILYTGKSNNVVSQKQLNDAYVINQPKWKYDSILDFILVICICFFTYQGLKMLILRQTLDYAAFFEMGRGQTQNRLTNYMDMLTIMLSLRCIFKGRRLKLIYGFYIISILIYMYVGARGLAIRYVATFLVTLPMVKPNLFKKKFWVIWFMGFIVSFSVLSVISNSRSSVLGSGFADNGGLKENIIGTIAEMGMSERPAIITIEAIDAGQRHYQTIASTILKALIPLSSQTSFCRRNSVALGDWVSHYVGSYHSGLGYSIVAEAYMNFDKFGWIFFLLWGYFICYAENRAYKNLLRGTFLWPIWQLTIVCTMVVFARGQFDHVQEVLRWGEYFLFYSLFTGKY